MPSTIGWLDQSEEQQRRMREVIALFTESSTVDDIGIGVVRDAFSDLLFPGMSTVQTRIRYFLFVPWVYQRLEAEKVSSARAEERARRWELDLIHSLKAGGEVEGVIGIDAGDNLKQLPSFAYWNGLRLAGIRQFNGTRADYHRSMDRILSNGRRSARNEGQDTIGGDIGCWHHNLPGPPDELWSQTGLALTAEEAAYLQERFVAADPNSLLAHLFRNHGHIASEIRLPWDAVAGDELRPVTQQRLAHARFFSEAILGAQLLYNLMLAEAAAERRLPRGEERLEQYRELVAEWSGLVDSRRAASDAVERSEFWRLVINSGANVRHGARNFIDGWLDLVAARVDVAQSNEARAMIAQRERVLKKGLARLHNARALENWGGASGSAQLSYRWGQGRSAANDIAEAFGAARV